MSKKDILKKFKLDSQNPPKLTPEQAKRLDNMSDADIDLSDIPELDAKFWERINSGKSRQAK